MNSPPSTPTLGTKSTVPESRPQFHAVAAYADDNCAEKITEVLHHLERRLGNQFDMSCESWDFERLAQAGEFQGASAAAAAADMVFLAVPTDRKVPPVVRSWLGESFALPAADDRALVVLLGGVPGEGVETEHVFRDLAAQSGADFFSHYFDPHGFPLLGLSASLDERSTRVTSLLEKILNQEDSAARHGLDR